MLKLLVDVLELSLDHASPVTRASIFLGSSAPSHTAITPDSDDTYHVIPATIKIDNPKNFFPKHLNLIKLKKQFS